MLELQNISFIVDTEDGGKKAILKDISVLSFLRQFLALFSFVVLQLDYSKIKPFCKVIF